MSLVLYSGPNVYRHVNLQKFIGSGRDCGGWEGWGSVGDLFMSGFWADVHLFTIYYYYKRVLLSVIGMQKSASHPIYIYIVF